MLTPEDMHGYQNRTVEHIIEHPESMLHQDPGLGKTIATLSAIEALKFDAFQVSGVLVIAPLRVVQSVWKQEAAKWSHTQNLTFSYITGDPANRIRGLCAKADIYLVNYENLVWLQAEVEHRFLRKGKYPPWNMAVLDEISKMKGTRIRQGVKRGGAMIKLLQYCPYRVGLTGTPAPNGLLDLFGQYLCIDSGRRLGSSFSDYRFTYFYQSDYAGYRYSPFERSKEQISEKISDITMDLRADDYLDMPDLINNDIMLQLPAELQADYDSIEIEMLVQLESGNSVEIFNKASLVNRCLQWAGGGVYLNPGSPEWEKVHDIKLAALQDLVDELNGQPVLLLYQFQHEAKRIQKMFPNSMWISSKTSASDFNQAIIDWNTGKLDMIIAHPACLHPETQVLTELRGWVNLIEVGFNEKVFDGIDFVNHGGCSYSGYEETVDVYGIRMTQNHKLLVGEYWVEAKNVTSDRNFKAKAVYTYKGDDRYLISMCSVRGDISNPISECDKTQSIWEYVLSALCCGQVPQYDGNENTPHLVWFEMAGKGHVRQKLRRAWDIVVRGMGGFQNLLRGYVSNLQRAFDYRADGCEPWVLQKELHLGNVYETAIQQTQQSYCSVSGANDALGRTLPCEWVQQNNVTHAIESRNDWRRSSDGRKEFPIRERAESKTKSHVYDLVNCGPRHRFLIKNDEGGIFISHNSMGHGVDRLQTSCHNIIWFGLNWSWELYFQSLSRIARQGQTSPTVMNHRLMMDKTVDLVVAMALQLKQEDETEIRDLIREYGKQKRINK